MAKKPDPTIYLKLNPKVLKALIERNLSFMEGLLDDTRKGILDIITDGLVKGINPRDMVGDIMAYGYNASRAEAIARTEVMYALNTAATESYKESGFEYVIWIAELDERTTTRDNSDIETTLPNGDTAYGCWDLDQTIWKIGEMPPIPLHVNCRCCTGAADEDEFIDMWGKR